MRVGEDRPPVQVPAGAGTIRWSPLPPEVNDPRQWSVLADVTVEPATTATVAVEDDE